MTTDLDRLGPLLAGDLEPDERLVAAIHASPEGEAHHRILQMAGMTQLGVAGAAAGDKLGRRARDAAASERTAAGVETGGVMNVLVTLTDRRLVLWKVGGLRSRPKSLLAELPRSDIADVTLGSGSLFGFSRPVIEVHTRTGPEIGLAVGKVQRRAAGAFVAAFA